MFETLFENTKYPEWIEFSIDVDIYEKVKTILNPLGYTPEDACSLFVYRLVEHGHEIIEKHKNGIPAEQLIRDLSDAVIKEIFVTPRKPEDNLHQDQKTTTPEET